MLKLNYYFLNQNRICSQIKNFKNCAIKSSLTFFLTSVYIYLIKYFYFVCIRSKLFNTNEGKQYISIIKIVSEVLQGL